MIYVAVIGPDDDTAASNVSDAFEVGRLLADRGAVVVTGGLGGVMAAAARGCTESGGTCLGLLPGTERDAGNPYLSIAVPTGLGELRNGLVVRSADGVIAVGGSWGTMSELALAMRTAVPVVSLNGWGVVDEAGRPVALETAQLPAAAVERIYALIEPRRAET